MLRQSTCLFSTTMLQTSWASRWSIRIHIVISINCRISHQTRYGTSTEFYNNLITAIYVVFQGSGLAQAIWLAISLFVIEKYVKKFPTDGTSNPTATDYITKVIDVFVDDTELWDVLFDYHITTEEQRDRIQQRAQHWSRIVNITGGKLNLAKCHWYLIHWGWDKDGFPAYLKLMRRQKI